ncbi:MAG TPA: C25 family cysteine peptidase [Chitinophagales bacterium]|nr:C25 family cysteine peptidase [Chitinophagales bacterium]
MKRYILILLGIIAFIQTASAETYGNEWINHDLKYYKFKLVDEGLYRIPKSALLSAGISESEISGNRARLFRLGQEIPIYVSNEDLFGDNDYIEFYGTGNDGSVDRQLYLVPEFQPNHYKSLYTDTLTYFLTFDDNNNNKRIVNVANDLSGELPVKEPYYYHVSKLHNLLQFFNPGENPNQLLNYVFDSEYDIGEGFSDRLIMGPKQNRAYSLSSNNKYTLQPELKAKLKGTVLFSNNSTYHKLAITVNNNSLDTLTNSKAGLRNIEYDIPIEYINNNIVFRFYPLIDKSRNGVYWLEFTYPRQFNFNNFGKLDFGVHKQIEAYVEIQNFNNKSTDAIIYDFKNNQRYIAYRDGDITKINFPQTEFEKDSLFISSQDTSDLHIINSLSEVKFIDPIEANYLIISQKSLTSGSDGINYVNEYAKYRSSSEGGSFQVATYMIDELENTFGYGIKGHPIAIRNAVNYLIDNEIVQPELLFIIGKGYGYHTGRNSSEDFIQSYGEPASDNLLVSRSPLVPYPQVGIGRLSARNSDEIKVYFEKVKEYEQTQKTGSAEDQTLERKEWMKSILHLGGGNFLDEQATFARYLENYKRIIEGPSFGGNVHSVYKNSTDPVQVAQSAIIDSMLYNGTSLVTFFGHSSTSTVDFDISPENFKNQKGKYPFMFTNGCFIGNVFEKYNSYSERFVLIPDKGAIGYLAPMTYAVAYSLNQYANNFYNRLGVVNYDNYIGNILKLTAIDVLSSSLQTDKFLGQQMIYHGDPGIKLNSFEKPDYIITENSISFIPEVVNASIDTFKILINQKNIGKSINSSYKVLVERQLPNGQIETYEKVVDAPSYSDSVYFSIPTNNISGLGQNSFYIKIDFDDEIDELSELNNEVTISRYFTIDDVLPIIPTEYSIVNQPNIEFKFSTANPLLETRRYVLQIDTTEFFNSPLLVTDYVNKSGGVINWTPQLNLINNKVYYWRGSLDTLYENDLSWNKSSFLYNTGLSEGWNQSHYFQFLPDNYTNINLKPNRKFSFIDNIRSIKVYNGIDAVGYNDRVLFADNSLIARNAFARSGFLFYVLDTKTGFPMSTYQIGNTGLGEYGNTIASLLTDVKIIEFNTSEQKGRYACYKFLNDIVPDQAIVCGYSFQNPFYSRWASDDSTLFNGETLYDAFERIGATDIRSVQEFETFLFFTQKGNPSFATQQIKGNRSEIIDEEFQFTGTWNNGEMSSTKIGPALKWNTIDYNWESEDDPITDIVTYTLFGYSKEGKREVLYDSVPKNADISFVDSKIYPYLQLGVNAKDTKNSTAPQFDYWRVIYDDVPEGAINPQKYLVKSKDTIPFGGTYKAAVAFENITDLDMDSILVKFTVKDASNQITVSYKRFAPLPGRKFIVIDFEYVFNQISNQGVNTIIFEANPDDDQLEKHHFNNFAIFTVVLEKDILNPIMDVTFDGRHITDGEIISPKPEILINLKDENKNLALNDTSLFKVFLTTPNSTTPISLDPRSNDFSFIPADESKLDIENVAKLFYRPNFAEDGTYELRVQGADRSLNDAGDNDYRVQFKIDSRPAISNFINYPNPFSTATQFVFTVTGTEIPTDIKIQIMTVSGKIVKEITAAELGSIHIGQNITNYKWNGTDTYGDKLANGLYLYRVTARINGKNMELLEGSTDKYFKKGFGKMYIVR